MLKRLHRKFVFINMLLITVVLVVVFSAICITNYQQWVSEVRQALDESLSVYVASASHEAPSTTGVPQIGGKVEPGDKHTGSRFIPVATYFVEEDGSLTILTEDNVSIETTILEQAALDTASITEGNGALDDLGLYYLKRVTADGTVIAFADTSYVSSSLSTLILTLAGVGACALIAFFIISLFLSKWALRPVDKAWEQQQRFVADASHELKTPLTVMLANNSILLAHKSDTVASQLQWVESTQSEAKLMQGLIDDMLFLAKPDNQQIKQLFTEVDFSTLLERNLLQFESVAYEKDIVLEGTIEPNVTLRGNETRLQRLISTLLDNACKYSNAGGTVTASLKQNRNIIQFSITNTGSTIGEEDLPYIFDRFYRSDKARTRDTGGYGLGLAIAKEVVEEHGGTISAQSVGNTTTFTATLAKTQ
ncbi:MAG: sensor histidine kinase [Actinobacteria bacterium]|nr:sensor histidine kinase [Actinomycetota bacterium]